MTHTVSDMLQESEARLQGVDSPRLSAQLLVSEVIGCSRLSLIVDRHRLLSCLEVERINELVSRRAAGEPIAYIVGSKEFYGLDFRVTPDVLIPRPETEHIVEEVEVLFAKEQSFHFADLGTGSGALAVTIASIFSLATGVAVDICPDALRVAYDNGKRHNVDDRLDFMLGDFTKPLFNEAEFDLIVSNPPYVTEDEYAAASHEVTAFEPVGALTSGVTGLDHIRPMLIHVGQALKSGGYFLLEIGCDQGAAVRKAVLDHSPVFGEVALIKDLANHDRVAFMQKK